jgi:phosphatidylglycerophosphate synthase
MESLRPQLLILDDAPNAFCTLFGISLLERLLRIAQRLGFREAVILSNSPKEVAAHLTKPSWARAQVALSIRARNPGALRVSEVANGTGRTLVVSAGFYYDARLLRVLAEQTRTTLLVDSAPPPDCALLWQDWKARASPSQPEGRASARPGLAAASPSERSASCAAALLDSGWLSRQDHAAALFAQLSSDAATGRIEMCDAARQPTYVIDLRKHVRPVFFPAPSPGLIATAERFPRDAAQNGVLDLPGFLDSPIEDWIVARLCRTSVTPNQVTFVTMLIGLAVTALFSTGHLWWGVVLAYLIEVLDGVDGKLARTKVEMTAAGQWEHVIDFFVEMSWWTALAFHFHRGGMRNAYGLLALLVGSALLGQVARKSARAKTGRSLDDSSGFDRFVRWIGGRRNINIWILAGALALGNAAGGFVLICFWGAATAAVQVVRAFQIRFGRLVVLDVP